MFISIVTPSYNRYQLLKESIHSSIKSAQTTEALVELIVVDDASTDDTFAKIQSDFSGLIDSGFIRVFKLDKNSGVTAAKNFGARKSIGEWVLFLDSDDLLIPEYFSTLRKVQCSSNALILVVIR
jgi:glycosyltransferase involved in cell wall biosynthesis